MVALIIGAAVSSAKAETLLGKDSIGGSLAILRYGDDALDTVFGLAYGFEGNAAINLTEHSDLGLSVAYVWADGEAEGVEIDLSAIGAGIDFVYSFNPGEAVNVYSVVGLMLAKTSAQVSGFGGSESADDTDLGWRGGFGVEFESSGNGLFRISITGSSLGDSTSLPLSGGCGYWFSDKMLAVISGTYDLDSQNTTLQVGIASLL